MKNSLDPRITLIDDLHPEDDAMIQALQSRSPASVEARLAKVVESGSGNFMDRYYVGYGHKSIGDCGTTTAFIEGGTMLTAKAVQDWPLYNGQEASTRYMDFSNMPFHNPLENKEGHEIQERWRAFYLEAQEPVKAHLRERYPIQDGEDQTQYDRAINARSFDILRSFLPAGASTNLSWHTNLRQAHDHLQWLVQHPDPFIAETAKKLLHDLKVKYRNSFNFRDDGGDEFRRLVLRNHHFLEPDEIDGDIVVVTANFQERNINRADLAMLQQRPKGVEVPRFLLELGHIRSEFALDFGSYRDLQRHRNGIIRMPLLTFFLGFNGWYMSELPDDLREKAKNLLAYQEGAVNDLNCDAVVAQNYMAMGYMVPCRVTQGLPGFVYRIELRSNKTVHPTLRRVVHEEIQAFRATFPNIPIFVDMDEDSWTVRRGKQTITEKT